MTFQRNAGAVARFGRLLKFGTWLQNIPNKITPPPFRLMQIGSAFWQSRALYVATRLDIATVLGDARLTAEEIAARVAASPDATYRLLRLLAAMGVFEETAPHTFRNNKLSACLRTDRPHNVCALILMHNSMEMSRPWFEQLEAAVRGGGVPFERAHGQELFAYLDGHPDFDALFARAMESVEALAGESYATDFDWGRFRRVIDVGGSRGAKSLAILKHHPQLTALVVDRAQVIGDAAQYWAGREDSTVLARLHFQEGDVLQSVPPAASDADIYLLCAVLHGFSDDACLAALRNLAAASAPHGATIALMEMVLPESGADMAGAAFDMQMFMGTRGRERTLTEWRRLFDAGGLALEEIVDLRSIGNILVVRPLG
jgi:hypothetical protein